MLGENAQGSLPDKSHFVVFDCFDSTLLKYFQGSDVIDRRKPRLAVAKSSTTFGRTMTAATARDVSSNVWRIERRCRQA